MSLPDLQTVANVVAGQLLNAAGAGIALAALVWIVLKFSRRQNSGTRFSIWFSALLAVAVLPLLVGANFSVHFQSPASRLSGKQILLSGSWAMALLTAWLAGACFFLLRLIVGLWSLREFRRNCSDIDRASLGAESAYILDEFETHRHVSLCVSNTATVPAAIGFFHPSIVFPAWVLTDLSSEEKQLILLHELAHLRRWDDWTNLAQKIVRAVFFFHPAVWWIDRRLTIEREIACDDLVLAQTTDPRAYASSLISFAEKLHGTRGPALAQALLSRMQQMSVRVSEILDPKRAQRNGLRGPIVGLSAVIIALVVGTSALMPHVIAFQTDTPTAPKESHFANVGPYVVQTSAGAVRSTAETPESAQHARAVAVAFHPRAVHPRASLVTGNEKVSPQKPGIVRVTASQADIPVQEIVVLRATQLDASGAAIWTLCVWRVGGDNIAPVLESAIFMGKI